MKKNIFKENKLGSGYLTPIYSNNVRIINLIRHLKGGRIHFGSYCKYYEDYKYDKPNKNKLF